MNPHKKTITDEASGILVENQRYLDYQEGAKEKQERIEQISIVITAGTIGYPYEVRIIREAQWQALKEEK